jgi:hypothetical protein
MFGKKKAPRRLVIPDEKIDKLFELTALVENEHAYHRVAQYNMWKYIAEIFPETLEGRWNLSQEGCKLFVLEKGPDDK